MGFGEDYRKRVSNKVRQDTLKIRALLRKRPEKTATLKSNQKCVVVLLNQKLSESSTLDTSVLSESTSVGNCSCDIELSYEDFVAEEAQVEAMERKSVPATVAHVRLLPTESLVEIVGINRLFDDQKSYDSDILALAKDDDENTRLTRVSTELACKELDKEEAAERDSERQLEATTTMYPNRDAEENVIAEPTSPTIGMTDAPSPTNAGRESKQNSVVPAPSAFCVDAKFVLELMNTLGSTFADILFDERFTESFPSLVKNVDNASLNEKGWNNSASLNGNGSVSDYGCLNEKVLATDDDHLMQVTGNFEPQNFDLREPKAVTSKSKIGLWKRLKERRHKVNNKSRKKLSEETKAAIKMMLAAKDANGERAEKYKKLPEATKMAIEMMLAAKDGNGESAEKYKKLPEETTMASEMMLAAKDANEESAKTGQKLPGETKMAIEMMLAAEDVNGERKGKGKKLSKETKIAIEIVLAVEDTNGESTETVATTLKKLRSLKRFNAIAEPLTDQESNADVSTTFMESEMLRVFENNALLTKKDDTIEMMLAAKDGNGKSAEKYKKLPEETTMASEMMLAAKDANEESAKTGQKLHGETKMAIEMVLAAEDANGESAAKGKKLSEETKMAIEIMLAVEDTNGESTETVATTLKKLRSLERFNAVAEPLRDQESNADVTTTFMESEMPRVFENNALLTKKDDTSYQSSLGHNDPDWESALSQVEEDGIIVNMLFHNGDPLCNRNTPVFIGGQKDGLAVWKGQKSGAYLKAVDKFEDKKGPPFNITVDKEEQDLEVSGSLGRSPKEGSAILCQTRTLMPGECTCTESVSQTDDEESSTFVTVDSSTIYWGTGMMRMLENPCSKDDPSYLSSLYYDDTDWESALSQVEEDGTIVEIFPYDEDSVRSAISSDFVGWQKDGFTVRKDEKPGAVLKSTDNVNDKKAAPLHIAVVKERQDLKESSGSMEWPVEGLIFPEDEYSVHTSNASNFVGGQKDRIAAREDEKSGAGLKATDNVDDKKAVPLNISIAKVEQDLKESSVSMGRLAEGLVVDMKLEKEAGATSPWTLSGKVVDATIPKTTAKVAFDEGRENVSSKVWDDMTRTEEVVEKRGIAKLKSLPLRRKMSGRPMVLKTEQPRTLESSNTRSNVYVMEVAGGSFEQIENKAEDWQSMVDPCNGKTYYFHRYTHKTTWEMPAGFIKVAKGDCAEPKVSKAAKRPVANPFRTHSDITGGTTSTEDVSQTDDEAESPKIGQAVEVAGDSTKILESKPVWKTTVDPNSGCSYYFNRLTRVTTWTIPPDFAKK